jgi:hypothetical protein
MKSRSRRDHLGFIANHVCSTRYLLLAIVGTIASLTAIGVGATSMIIPSRGGRYDGISCNHLMSIYKRAYISVGFRLDRVETMSGFFEMTLSFPHPNDPKNPSGGGSFRFFLPATRDLSCSAYMQTMGVLGHYDAYNLEEHIAFGKVISAADQKAQALIAKKLGGPKPE